MLLDRFSHGLPFEKCQTDHLVNNREIFMSPGVYSKLQGKNIVSTYDA